MSAPAPLIELLGVSRWYGEVIGLNDVSIAMQPGLIGLLGPNGAGKSTLLRLLTGQIRPNLGEVKIFGERVWRNPGLLRRIGYCQESEAMYGHMTGHAFVTAIARLRGLSGSEAKDRAAEELERMGMKDAMHRPIEGYSKGMRQRTKIAQALMGDPDLLILDEPLNGADPIGRSQILNVVRELGRKGKSVLISSHVLHEVEQVTDTVLLINRGRILAAGRIHEIRDALDDVPHRISIVCRPVRALAAAMMDKDYILGVELAAEDNRVHLLTTQPGRFYDDLPGMLESSGVSLDSLESADDSLDAIFRYLVK